MKQDKTPRNKGGQKHGLWVWYNAVGRLCWIENYNNGQQHGMAEYYFVDNKEKQTHSSHFKSGSLFGSRVIIIPKPKKWYKFW